MEYVNCNLCGSPQAEPLFLAKDLKWQMGSQFQILRCKSCGLAYLNPRPPRERLKQYYPENYWGNLQDGEKNQDEVRKRRDLTLNPYHLEDRALEIERVRNPGRLLDVGCGTGDFLVLMKERGWQVKGVDISRKVVEYAQKKLGKNVFLGDLFEANFPSSFFDVVTLNGVLEHLPNPKEILKEINRIMKSKGLIVTLVPNIGSLQARLFKSYWYALDIPRHLYHFSPDTLSQLLTQCGFKVLRVDHFDTVHSPYSFKLSTIFLLKHLLSGAKKDGDASNKGKDAVLSRKRSSFWREVGELTLEVVAKISTFMESLLRREAVFTVYAQKSHFLKEEKERSIDSKGSEYSYS